MSGIQVLGHPAKQNQVLLIFHNNSQLFYIILLRQPHKNSDGIQSNMDQCIVIWKIYFNTGNKQQKVKKLEKCKFVMQSSSDNDDKNKVKSICIYLLLFLDKKSNSILFPCVAQSISSMTFTLIKK